MAGALVAGLEIVDGLPDGDIPTSAVMVIKTMGADGVEGYLTRSTDGLSSVEALGMAHLLVARLTQVLATDDPDT